MSSTESMWWTLPALPSGVRLLTDEERERLHAERPTLPPSPHAGACVTCVGRGEFRWYPLAAGGTFDYTSDPVVYRCSCVDQWILHRYLLNAGIGTYYGRLYWADLAGIERSAYEFVASYLEDVSSFLQAGLGLLLHGKRGTGKTLIVTLLLKSLLAQGVDAYFTTFGDAIERFASGWRSDEDKRWFHARIKNAQVLAIDDPGKEMSGRAQVPQAVLDEVIRHRVASQMPTLVMTNLSLDDFGSRYGEYVLSLLQESCWTHEFTGKDWRPQARDRKAREAHLKRPVWIG